MNRGEKENYLRDYEVLKKKGTPFFPYAVLKDSTMALIVALVIVALSIVLGAEQGPKVDPSDVLPTGDTFANIDELKLLLLKDRDQLARALAEKLLTYGTGARPSVVDQDEIEAIVRAVRAKNYGFRTLIHEVVKSKVFQTK